MSGEPPPLKRPRLRLGASHFSDDNVLSERTDVAEAVPITFVPSIAKLGTTSSCGAVQCAQCLFHMGKVNADRADPLDPSFFLRDNPDPGKHGHKQFDVCFLCGGKGHWISACPLTPTGGFDETRAWFVKTMIEESQSQGEASPSLLELSAISVSSMPVDYFLQEGINLPQHVAAAEVIPRLPFRLIDRLYYEQSPMLSGTITTEVHAVVMRRFHACILHILYLNVTKGLDTDVDIPLWDVFGDSNLLFSERMNHRGKFEEGGDFLFADAPPRRVVSDEETALANFNRLSCGLITPNILERDEVVVAGGMILGSLLLDPDTPVQDSPYKDSDIDIFVLGGACTEGTPGECVGQTTLALIIDNYERLYPEGAYVLVCRKFNDFSSNSSMVLAGCVVTCLFEGEFPSVQVILKDHIRSTAELLTTFDVDCCAVALSKGRFVASSCAARALAHGYNIFNPTFALRKTGINRLIKYSHRGFPVFVPLKVSDLSDQLGVPDRVDDSSVLIHLRAPYIERNEDLDSYYAPPKIPKEWTTILDIEAHFEGCDDVETILGIDGCNYGKECNGGVHLLDNNAPAPAHDVAQVKAKILMDGLASHPLLAPIMFPCSNATIHSMVRLKPVNDKVRAKRDQTKRLEENVELIRDAFVDPKRPEKRKR